jgi:hypothetical protein
LNEIDTIFSTDAVNITLSDYMEHGVDVDMTDILSTDDNGDRDADMQTDSGVLHPSMIALMVLGLATLVIVVILLLIRWQRQRFQRCAWNTAGRPLQPQQVSVLTFANPNYTPSAPDVVVADKKTFSWQRWKYDRTQERVYDMQVM